LEFKLRKCGDGIILFMEKNLKIVDALSKGYG